VPESETFDAFYARTVWSVTSQIHELAGNDGAADHAIREAYAKAYQQWYQVSGYSDAEGWVLATARDAFERRRAAAAATGQPASSPVPDSGRQ
jgi:predicted RNA polymerase sigma factor